MSKTGMLLVGVLGSECRDSSSEVLGVANADVSDCKRGTMLLNWNHKNSDSVGASANDIVGKVIYVKKILKEEDVTNDLERKYWEKCRKKPYILGVSRLFDTAGHPGAQALAAIIRDNYANGEDLVLRFSVEGAVLERDGDYLTNCVIRKVAVTEAPCNKTAVSDLIADPNAPEGYDKNAIPKSELSADIQNVLKTERLYPPDAQPLGQSVDTIYSPVPDDLLKTITAGSSNVAPSAMTGGAALQREGLRPRLHRALNSYKFKGNFNKSDFRLHAQKELPDVSDEFLDHFADVAEKMHVKGKVPLKKGAEHVKEVALAVAENFLHKFERLTIELRKAEDDLKKLPHPATVRFGGRDIKPGVAETAHGKMALLHETPDFFVAVPQDKAQSWKHDDLRRLPTNQAKTHYRVLERPTALVASL
jgi:hypothetical protein